MAHDVVVLGAGYAGVVAAKRLARQAYADEVTVTLVSGRPGLCEAPPVAPGRCVPPFPHDDSRGEHVPRHGHRPEMPRPGGRYPASGFGVGVRVGLGGLPDAPAPHQWEAWEP